MPTPRSLLCAGLAAGLLLGAPEAEARFGKRSKSSSSESKKKVHDATPVGEDSDDEDDSSSSSSGSSGGYHSGPSWLELLLTLLVDTTPPPPAYGVVAEPEATMSTRSSSGPDPLALRLGLEGGSMGGGANVGVFLGVEGERMGLFGRATSLSLPTDDGTEGTDSIGLFEANLSVALWTSERGRFRVEGGLAGASAPDIAFLGLNMAASLEACLAGPLDLEARLQGVPFPYRQLDAQLGLALHLGHLSLRGGWRGMVLDDAGLVDGVQHVDKLSGPYLGAGLMF